MKICLTVVTNAKSERIERLAEGNWKIWVAGKPIEGRANEKIVEMVSKELGIGKSLIKIVSGIRSRHKIVEITD